MLVLAPNEHKRFTRNTKVKSGHITTDWRMNIRENFEIIEGLVTHMTGFQESLSIYLKNELHRQPGGHNG